MPIHQGCATRESLKGIQSPESPAEATKFTGGSKKGHKTKGQSKQSKHDKMIEKAGWPAIPIGGDGT